MKYSNKFLKKQLDVIGEEAINFLTKLLTENDKKASGDLINSLDYDVIERGNNVLLEIIADKSFKYVDEGRKSGSKAPPNSAISSWIKAKGIKVRNYSNGRFITREQASYIISRGIAKNGIKALNMKQKLIKEVFDKKDKILKDSVSMDIQELINRMFYKNT